MLPLLSIVGGTTSGAYLPHLACGKRRWIAGRQPPIVLDYAQSYIVGRATWRSVRNIKSRKPASVCST
jgi:hypothetical protein